MACHHVQLKEGKRMMSNSLVGLPEANFSFNDESAVYGLTYAKSNYFLFQY